MTQSYRKGAIGALLDEYERAISDLKIVISTIPDNALTIITDPHTADDNCRSVQTILSHIVHSGYGYATSIHNLKGHNKPRPGKIFHLTIKEYIDDLTGVISFTEEVLNEFKDEELEQLDNALKIHTGWGQQYDVEQLMEHAIVHILRHRRQIEKINGLRL
jgi:uncharacterized damage-inducible protein DinB